VRTDHRERANRSTGGELAGQARAHVDRVRQFLVQSEQAAQRAAARRRENQPRGQGAVRRAEHLAAAAQRATTATVDRVLQVKLRELAAHRAAVALQEQAAELQARLGHPERAAAAWAHARHAREPHRRADAELADYLGAVMVARGKASR
jgi:hypothetical protein